jgi:hypothetical protein
MCFHERRVATWLMVATETQYFRASSKRVFPLVEASRSFLTFFSFSCRVGVPLIVSDRVNQAASISIRRQARTRALEMRGRIFSELNRGSTRNAVNIHRLMKAQSVA